MAGMPPNGAAMGHAPHDSGLSVGSSREEDVTKIKELEEEVRRLVDRTNLDGKYAGGP